MSNEEEFEGPQAPFTITLKGGSGYDKPWLVLRGQSAEDAVALLVEAQATELLDRIAEYAAEFQGKVAGAAPDAPAKSSDRSTGSPSRSGARGGSSRGSAPAQSSSDVEYHPEGLKCSKCQAPVIYKKITSKAGKTFELWVCENQRERNDGHHADFIN